MSPTRETNTPESAPDGFAAPFCAATSRSAITVTWSPPTMPNGRITEYVMLPLNSILFYLVIHFYRQVSLSLSFGFVIIEHRYRIQRGNESATTSVGLTTSFTAISLEPYTLYDFRVLACTNAGCSASAAGVCSTTTVF